MLSFLILPRFLPLVSAYAVNLLVSVVNCDIVQTERFKLYLAFRLETAVTHAVTERTGEAR